MKARKLYEIAFDIHEDWHRLNFASMPYVKAMMCLESVRDYYGLKSGREIVKRFLATSSTWRGEKAQRIKNELEDMLKQK